MKKYGVKVHTAYIAEMKAKCGIIERQNYNKSKKSKEEHEKAIRHCTKEKEEMIGDAFRHFKLKSRQFYDGIKDRATVYRVVSLPNLHWDSH